MRINLLFGLLAIFLLHSCESNTKLRNTDNSIYIDVEAAEDIELSSIAESIRYVPLETTLENYTGNFAKVVIHKDRIIAQGANEAGQFIAIYDLNGKKMGVINKQGKGPGEFIEITDFLINPFNDQIELLDGRYKQKVYRYDLNGEFINELALPIRTNTFAMNEPGSYYLYNRISFGPDKNPHNVIRITYDRGEIIGRYVPGNQIYDGLNSCDMILYKTQVGIRNGSRDSIFFVDEKGKHAGSFFIDFGPKHKEFIKLYSKFAPSSKEAMDLYNSFVGHCVLGDIRSSDDFLFMPVTKVLGPEKRTYCIVLYNWENQNIIQYKKFTNDIDGIPLGGGVSCITKERELIMLVRLEKMMELSVNPPSDEFRKLLPKILPHPESDAPVLAFVKLKSDI